MRQIINAAPITINPSSLPDGVEGQSQDIQFSASGGAGGPYVFSVIDTQDLPPGMGMSSTGEYKGVPTTPGTFDFDIRVTDNAGNTADF
jgi:hypothetical protein